MAVTLCGALASAPSASAYGHTWSCSAAADGSQCYDYSGTIYNPWLGVYAYVYDYSLPSVCAKGITAAGNIRSGSGCMGGFYDRACFSGGSPSSWGYVYWDGIPGGYYPIEGHASTDSCPAGP
jgi:hypothetical protein